jgi:glycerol-3-phosphate acyltransferase PlsY
MPWLIVILAYFVGSIPTAYIAGRLLKGRDIRQMGDGNMGAQNAFRQLGARVGITVGVIDAAKGGLAVLIAQTANLPLVLVMVTGAVAIVGHNWPLFLRFRGGRGESTAIGVLTALVTVPMLILAVPTILVLWRWHNVTKASAVLFVPLSLLCWWLNYPPLLIGYSIGIPCLVGLTHYLRMRHPPAERRVMSG